MPTKIIICLLIIIFNIATLSGCTNQHVIPDSETDVPENGEEESQVFGEISKTAARLTGEVTIVGSGTFLFDPAEVTTVRDDIFREGYFSIFDVLVHLEKNGYIEMDYYYDEKMNTYVISSMEGEDSWWYDAYYDGGWPEQSVFRMDHYPYKDKMRLRFNQRIEEYVESVYATYRDEIRRKEESEGRIIVPNIYIKGENNEWHFENVEVTASNLRSDMFQDDVVTAIDTIISLGEAGLLSYDLQWYESIGTAEVVNSYWVERINEDQSQGRCGFVYEAGNEEFNFIRGNHIHIPSDVRVINSPEYVFYFWICI